MDFLGEEIFRLRNSLGPDKIHMVTIYRFVRKYVTVDYLGYILQESSRKPHAEGSQSHKDGPSHAQIGSQDA
jgi:hypothetical protein